jgi:hypothetical protein
MLDAREWCRGRLPRVSAFYKTRSGWLGLILEMSNLISNRAYSAQFQILELLEINGVNNKKDVSCREADK